MANLASVGCLLSVPKTNMRSWMRNGCKPSVLVCQPFKLSHGFYQVCPNLILHQVCPIDDQPLFDFFLSFFSSFSFSLSLITFFFFFFFSSLPSSAVLQTSLSTLVTSSPRSCPSSDAAASPRFLFPCLPFPEDPDPVSKTPLDSSSSWRRLRK